MSAVEASSELVDGKYYEVVAPQSFSERMMIRARDRIYDDFMRMCRPGRDDAVLDVGVSRVDGKLAGDVAADVWDVAGWVSPNPGGVGPMTRAMLLYNVVGLAEHAAASAAG